MLQKLLAFAFLVLVFIGLGISGILNAAFAGYDRVEKNPVVQQVQNKALTIENAMHGQLENAIRSELPH